MSLIQMRFFSEELNMFTGVNIILPLPRDAKRPVSSLPALYLLHGMGDNHTAWLRKTCVERYALKKGVAVIMPDGGLSCWEDMVHGGKYRSYVCSELPEFICKNFPVTKEREKTFIAGCSMGGFGALKLALSYPEKYSAAGCFSGAHFEYRPVSARHDAMIARVYGDELDAFDARIAADAASVNSGSLPLRIWHSCGDEDALKENALKTRDFFENLPGGSIDYRFEMLPGRHDWALWDASLARFMDNLDLPDAEVQLF